MQVLLSYTRTIDNPEKCLRLDFTRIGATRSSSPESSGVIPSFTALCPRSFLASILLLFLAIALYYTPFL